MEIVCGILLKKAFALRVIQLEIIGHTVSMVADVVTRRAVKRLICLA